MKLPFWTFDAFHEEIGKRWIWWLKISLQIWRPCLRRWQFSICNKKVHLRLQGLVFNLSSILWFWVMGQIRAPGWFLLNYSCYLWAAVCAIYTVRLCLIPLLLGMVFVFAWYSMSHFFLQVLYPLIGEGNLTELTRELCHICNLLGFAWSGVIWKWYRMYYFGDFPRWWANCVCRTAEFKAVYFWSHVSLFGALLY